jgi:Xaa-Pro aminopeptidase
MTLAIEPKIGICGIGMVGIENTFEVTKNGGQSLTGENCEMITIPGRKK